MVVRTTTACDAARQRVADTAGPVRTCIGCRRRAAAAELLRVVADPNSAGTADLDGRPAPLAGPRAVPVVPDPRRRATGRGAWLHRDPACAALAQRRRAFARALRVPGAVDPAAVLEYVTRYSGAPT